ncbi:MAG: MFS transporter [Anaerolineae bacterium]|nr:MFS transporter [Anaerolineae bacterium]
MTASGEAASGVQGAVRRRPLLALYAASLISVTGDSMAAVAIPWFVLLTTGSAVQTGVAAFFSVTPIIIGMVFGGTVVDRTGFRRISIAADLASGVMILLIPLLHFTIGLSFPALLALVFLSNLLDAPGGSARRAMLPELAAAAGIPIEKATAYAESVSRATLMIGAPAAGLLVTLMGAPVVLLVDAVTFLVSALIVGAFVPAALVEQKAPAGAPKTSYMEDLREGFRFVRHHRLILAIIVVVMFTNMIDSAAFSVSLPVWAETVFGVENGAVNLGLLIGVFGGAALVGAFLYSLIATKPSRRLLLGLGFGMAGVMQIMFAAAPPLWALIGLAILTGILVAPLNPLLNTLVFERVPVELRARVMSLLSAGVMVGMPLGALAAGYVLEFLGVQVAYVLYGSVYLIAALIFRFHPALRDVEARNAPTVEAVSTVERSAA